MRKKPERPAPRPSGPESKPLLHPRNRHQGRYDFPALIKASPELAAFVILNPYGKESIDFANPAAVKVFNRALLRQLYGIQHWDIPQGYLCPPIPGRADYVHGLADVLAQDANGVIPRGKSVHALDVGTGANCIYPLIGHCDYGWHFLGVDIDPTALASASVIVQSNQGLSAVIKLRQQMHPEHIFHNLLQSNERFEVTLCNPPFHASREEATRGSQRKWKNLGKLDSTRKLPTLNFGGQGTELWCPGGEAGFLQRMFDESTEVKDQVLWFSSLVSKASNLPTASSRLTQIGAKAIKVIDMAQGQKQSRFIAWSFHDSLQRAEWLKH